MPECARFQSSAYTPKVGDIIHADYAVGRKPCAFVYIVCRVSQPEGGFAPALLAVALRNPIASEQKRIADLPPVLCNVSIGSLWHLAGPNPPRIR